MSKASKGTTARTVRLDREERRILIAKACAELIATDGYSQTSIRNVAAKAGISSGTLLHHFESKEALLVATLLQVSDDFFVDIRKAANGPGDPVERLRRAVRAILNPRRHAVGWRVWIAFWHEASINAELGAVAGDRTDLSEAIFTQLIADGVASGALRVDDPAVASAELAALIDGVALRMYGESNRWTAERAAALAERLIDDWRS
jgi:AcrR family transcriptional regulator